MKNNISGENIYQYSATKCPILEINPTTDDFQAYYTSAVEICLNYLSKSLQVIHSYNIVIGDLSSSNVLIDNNLKISFLDLEGARKLYEDEEIPYLFSLGFIDKMTMKRKGATIESGLYALGCIMCNLFTLQNNQFKINSNEY